MSLISDYLSLVCEAISKLPQDKIEDVVATLKKAHADGKQVFLLGNGGSAANATHIAEDMQKGVKEHTGKRFKVLALTDSLPLVTAWANDTSYEAVFAEQIDSLLDPGDVVIAISGSGNSPNVLRAVEKANEMGGDHHRLVRLLRRETGPDRAEVDRRRQRQHAARRRRSPGARPPGVYVHGDSRVLRAVFLDRDGCINEDRDDYVKNVGELKVFPYAADSIRMLNEAGFEVFVVSNQQSLGKGLMTQQDLLGIQDEIMRQVEGVGRQDIRLLLLPAPRAGRLLLPQASAGADPAGRERARDRPEPVVHGRRHRKGHHGGQEGRVQDGAGPDRIDPPR